MRTVIKADSCKSEKGYSIVELLVALGMGMVALAAFYSVFSVQSRRLSVEEQIVEMQQNVRNGMDVMIAEVRMAGYDPTGAGNFDGITCDTTQLRVKLDLDGDGSVTGANEDVIYKYDSANLRITRNTGGGAQPFMENIQAFSFQYLDSNGNVTTDPAQVRQVKISVTGRTAKRDPDWPSNGGYRTYTLTSYVTPRNLYY